MAPAAARTPDRKGPPAMSRPVSIGLRLAAVAAVPLAALLLGVSIACAQGELEQTPWATTMIYPVGDPLDFQQPAPGETQGFALSRGLRARGDRHEGLDLSNRSAGGQVRAVAPGLVVTTRTGWAGGWGNMVVLAHRLPGGDLLFSLFAHLLPGSIAVREGEVVALGQPLGRIGSTGHSSGPHLHLEFREMKALTSFDTTPLGEAWMKASIVDPLRVLSTMMPRGPTTLLDAALARTSEPMSVDPLLALAQRGALPKKSLESSDDALTRGELYRIAATALSPGQVPPVRWAKLKTRVLAQGAKLPPACRAPFALDRLPRREADTREPATLAETIAVFGALERAGKAVPAGAAVLPSVTDRRTLDDQFAHGLLALEAGETAPAGASAGTRLVGPPAVSRRQASLLWSYLESGRAPEPGSAAAQARTGTR